MGDLQVCLKNRGVGRGVFGDKVRLNSWSLCILNAGMFFKMQADIDIECKSACPELTCYMLELVNFAYTLNFCLPGSYLPVISVRI